MKLFILSTPSQAFFLSKTSNIIDENSVLLITKNKEEVDKKIIAQLHEFTWANILVWDVIGIENPASYYKIFLFRIKIALLKRKYSKIKELYIGSYDNLFHLGLAAAFENKARLYLLYDGLQMVTVAGKRLKNIQKSLRPYSKIFNWAGFKLPSLKSISYTSPLNFKIPEFDHIIKIKGCSNKTVLLEEKQIYFAGQPLVDMGVLTIETYIKKLRLFKVQFYDYDIIYIPHPKESNVVKNEISKIFKIGYFNTIFEEEYLKAIYFAKIIASFYSSVLINLLYLAGENLDILAIQLNDSEILIPSNRKTISSIYDYFHSNETTNFKVVNL